SKGVRYGVRNVHVAWFDEETEQYGIPLALPGCRSIKTSPEGDTKKWFADDTVYYVGRANNGYTADLEMAKVALEVMAAAQGWELDPETGVLYEVTDGEEVNKPFALLYEVEGDVTNTLLLLLRDHGQAGKRVVYHRRQRGADHRDRQRVHRPACIRRQALREGHVRTHREERSGLRQLVQEGSHPAFSRDAGCRRKRAGRRNHRGLKEKRRAQRANQQERERGHPRIRHHVLPLRKGVRRPRHRG
ncbi:MAG: major tail protein, partial [Coriobacteriaceae bacterium]